jgi:hypothetical protein
VSMPRMSARNTHVTVEEATAEAVTVCNIESVTLSVTTVGAATTKTWDAMLGTPLTLG